MPHEVDVLLPIRNPRADWLEATLASIESQADAHLRLVIVLHPDDQGIEHLFNDLSIAYDVYPAPTLGNISDALNVGLNECTAKFVARIDADDIAHPLRLRQQINFLNENPSVAAVGSHVKLIDSRGSALGIRKVPCGAVEVMRVMRWKTSVMHPSVTFRTETIKGTGGYRPEAAGAEDYDLWLRLLRQARVDNLDQVLTTYRVHANQISSVQPISKGVAKNIGESRLNLASAKGESLLAAKFRHSAWQARQKLRGLAHLLNRS